ncbi:MAG: hypothetical protein AAGA08_16120 [Pseudomonadota bacterium]
MHAPSLSRPTFEIEHALWAAGLAAITLLLVFGLKLIFGQGLTFWFDLAEALPWMIAGGLCSDAMMVKIVASAINLSATIAAYLAFRAIARKLRFAFDAHGRGFCLALPGQTRWQARLLDLQLKRKYAVPRLTR